MNVEKNKLHWLNDSVIQRNFESINRNPNNKLVLSTIKMRLLETESVNRNNRFYGKEILDVILNSPFVKESLKNHSMVGELEHPSDGRYYTDYDKASHIITDLWKKDNWLWGSIDILNTPAGQKIQAIIDAGCSIGISARGYGSHTNKANDPVDYIDSDTYELFTFDFTNMPGFAGARLEQNFKNNSKRESLHDNILSTLNQEVNTKTCANIKTICEYQNSVGNNFNDILEKLELKNTKSDRKEDLFEENKKINRRYDLVQKERTKLNKKTAELNARLESIDNMQLDIKKRLKKLESTNKVKKTNLAPLKNQLREAKMKLENERHSKLNLITSVNNLKLENRHLILSNQKIKNENLNLRKKLKEMKASIEAKKEKAKKSKVTESKKQKIKKSNVTESKKQKIKKSNISENVKSEQNPNLIQERQSVQQVYSNNQFPQNRNTNSLAEALAQKAQDIFK